MSPLLSMLFACGSTTPPEPPVVDPSVRVEVQANEAYWVKRSDLELDAELRAACERAVAAEQGVLLAFSAQWCGDCKRVRQLQAEPALHDELAHWQEVVADVGRFDRHQALRTHFAVAGIAHWVALRPTSCVEPVTRWPVLRAGQFEPATDPTGPRTSEALAAWLATARAG